MSTRRAPDDIELMTLEEVLATAAERGLELSERTFRYYAVLGLLPAPVKRPSGKEDARVHYYPADIVRRLLELRDLQAQGYTLKQIKAFQQMQGTVPPSPRGRGRGVETLDAAGLLTLFASDTEARAWDRFVAATSTDDEDALRSAALQYYRDLLAGFAPQAVQTALGALTPLQLDALILRLRSRRGAAAPVDAARFEVMATLRRMVTGLLQGRRLAASDVDRLRRCMPALAALERKVAALELPARLEPPRKALATAFGGLSRATVTLLADPPDAAAAQAEIDRADRLLETASAFLHSLRRLHEEVPHQDSAG